ncbi:hypothetical protein H4O18_08260 [Arenibacter sp. BSSL-BM3]|uniref:Uncharacterized protein n=1 Tax=Arenibacter arenosicollis TaxID=2762274 RepID=A0ABR7QLB5_9FLAO|nr:hypothetical protein [Arenibacter arenosicollis]MBC8767982.1 hypothetical protein [Arenibacter arenosicollis]
MSVPLPSSVAVVLAKSDIVAVGLSLRYTKPAIMAREAAMAMPTAYLVRRLLVFSERTDPSIRVLNSSLSASVSTTGSMDPDFSFLKLYCFKGNPMKNQDPLQYYKQVFLPI